MNQKVKVPASEIERLHAMTSYERNLFAAGVQYIAGIDEAGRGPIAGPVVAAAVILPRDFFVPEVDDSKRLKPLLRKKLSLAIKRQALDWSIGIVSVSCLDQINIYQATKLAMITAFNNLVRAAPVVMPIKLPGSVSSSLLIKE